MDASWSLPSAPEPVAEGAPDPEGGDGPGNRERGPCRDTTPLPNHRQPERENDSMSVPRRIVRQPRSPPSDRTPWRISRRSAWSAGRHPSWTGGGPFWLLSTREATPIPWWRADPEAVLHPSGVARAQNCIDGDHLVLVTDWSRMMRPASSGLRASGSSYR